MILYPDNAVEQLEFTKVTALLQERCRMDWSKQKAQDIRLHTKAEFIQKALQETFEFKLLLEADEYFPNEFIQNIHKELKLLGITNAVLSGEQIIAIKKLAENTNTVFRWLTNKKLIYPALYRIIEDIPYEKRIREIIDKVVDPLGVVLDTASPELLRIRQLLARTRAELRKTFEKNIARLSKQGYLADIVEGFMNGRRVVAINAENKRIVKGILHGESESQRTVYIEPEETIHLNNEVASLEREEGREVHRILMQLTADLSPFQPLLQTYYGIAGEFDFIRAKALLGKQMNATLPRITPHPQVHLVQAYHPLLLLYNQKQQKPTMPLDITLDKKQRILIISGPNAGGKTVSMKTVGLLQMMVQCGLLVPVHHTSEMGIFKQLMIHIGDTQSLEYELSTYSAHLKHMKHFLDFADGKTLFFIDELGGGSDPAMGGAFAEVIMEELARKHAMGIVTTHYLNLKIMAGKTQGILNGAMGFDEENLQPQYKLNIGKPGSSYTFAIAQRSGLQPQLINRAKQLVDQGHFRLDKLLHQTEQGMQKVTDLKKETLRLMEENEVLKSEYERLIDKERKHQHFATLKLQNEIKQQELDYLRDMERKFKQIIQDWKKTDDKQKVIKDAENLLFRKKQIQINASIAKKTENKYDELPHTPQIGDLVKNRKNFQVGKLSEVRDKTAIVQIGRMPFQMPFIDLVAVKPKPVEEDPRAKKKSKKA
jgi:DNA mismatch repair protein MutS2